MVNYNIKGTGLPVTDELRAYVEKRFAAAEKFLQDDPTVHADVELEHAPGRTGPQYRAELTLSSGGEVYRAEEWRESLHEAVDVTTTELAKELRRSKRKHVHLVRRGGAAVKDILRGFRDRF